MDTRLEEQGANVSLSGNLGFVSLDEVLRLLTRSKQQGTVDVQGGSVRGRVFVERGGVGLATTFTDDALHQHLLRSGLIESAQLDTVRSGNGDMSAVTSPEVEGLLREMTVESVYQLGTQGETFEVIEGKLSTYVVPKPFELEELLADAKQRLDDWAEVRAIVSDLDRQVAFRRELGEREQVTIQKDQWRLLSEVGTGSSVRRLAEGLGTTEFWTASVAAGLIEEDLVSLDDTAEVAESPAVEAGGEWTEPAAGIAADTSVEDESVSEDAVEAVTEEADEDADAVDPNQSWWEEPEAEADDDQEVAEEATPAASYDESSFADSAEAEASEAPAAVATDTAEVAEDTEAFLEKVFSELEPAEEEVQDEGYGLLRRRRMGALRDLSNDS